MTKMYAYIFICVYMSIRIFYVLYIYDKYYIYIHIYMCVYLYVFCICVHLLCVEEKNGEGECWNRGFFKDRYSVEEPRFLLN